MAKDPAFLFYPGDYLRDTQNLSEKSQVAYDRIMCEHMRNICEDMNNITVSKRQVDFFIKRLTDDEKEELMFVLIKNGTHYQIEWVALSIAKRKIYSNSRSQNRMSKSQTDKKIISKTYDSHMENENENEDINKRALLLFDQWMEYRKSIKKEITVEATIDLLVKRFNEEPIEKIKWVVNHSIENNYQGLFWDKYTNKNPEPKKVTGYLYQCPNCNKTYEKPDRRDYHYRCEKNKCQEIQRSGGEKLGIILEYKEEIYD